MGHAVVVGTDGVVVLAAVVVVPIVVPASAAGGGVSGARPREDTSTGRRGQ